MSLGNEFQVCLPSNVFGNKKNTPGQYETTLARPLDLNGSWECALIDITYPNSWVDKINVQNECIVIISGFFTDSEKATYNSYDGDDSDEMFVRYASIWAIMESRGRRAVITDPPQEHESFVPKKSFKLKPGYYDVKEIIALLQKDIRSFATDAGETIVSYDKEQNRVKISGNKRKLALTCPENNPFFKLLGFQSQSKTFEITNQVDEVKNPKINYLVIDKNSPIEANNGILINPINSIFLYSNITNHILVGNTQTPLLGYFPVQTISGQQGYWNFNPPYYLPVKESIVHTIQIRMCNDTGEDIKFETGTVICRLNFRRVGTLRGIV